MLNPEARITGKKGCDGFIFKRQKTDNQIYTSIKNYKFIIIILEYPGVAD